MIYPHFFMQMRTMRLRKDTVAQATQSLILKSITGHMTTQQQDATEGTGLESI